MLHPLKRLGVRLALDDFGVGQSSLAHVSRLLPIDVVKVDRSFVRGANLSRDRAVLDAISVLARSLSLTAIAEGIENSGQASALARLGYPLGQGFLFARPGPAEQVRAYVERAARPATSDAADGGPPSAGVVVDQPV